MSDRLSCLRPRGEWFSAPNLLAAGLFCLFVGIGGGAKPIAVGQALVVFAVAKSFFESGASAFSWGSLPASARCLAAFLAISLLSIVANWEVVESPVESLGKLRYHVLALVLLSMSGQMRGLLRVAWRRDSLALAWILPLAFAIAVGLYAYAVGRHPLRGDDVVDIFRVSGLYGQVMTFAYSLQFSVVVLAGFVLVPNAWRAVTRVPWWTAAAMFLVSGAALYLTYTRGAVLGAAAGLALMAMRRSRKLGVAVASLGVVGAAVLAILAIQEMRESEDGSKGGRTSRYLQLHSDIRMAQWRAAALSFVERPVFGWGYRNFEAHSAALKERYGFEKDVVRKRGQPRRVVYFEGHAHNNYLEAFASTGVFGGLAFIAFCCAWLREAGRSRFALLFLPPVAAFLVSGLFENTFFDSEVLNCILLLWLLSQWVFERERSVEEVQGLDGVKI